MNPTNYLNSNQHNLFHHQNQSQSNQNQNQSNQNRSNHSHDQSEHHSAHVHPHYHEHHQILYPNNLATHMMAVKVSWYRATRSVIEISGAIFLMMGTAVFMTGFLKLLWARSALTSIQAGSYMIGSFLTISSATLGLIGAYQENWCLITSYACVQLSLFVIRTVILMVLIKINYSSGFDDSFKRTKPFSDIPYLISGLPGTSDVVPLELLYSVIEISLCVSAFYVSYAINNASKEHIHHESQTYVLPIGENPNSVSSNVRSSNLSSSNVRSPNVLISTPRSQNVTYPNVGISNLQVSKVRVPNSNLPNTNPQQFRNEFSGDLNSNNQYSGFHSSNNKYSGNQNSNNQYSNNQYSGFYSSNFHPLTSNENNFNFNDVRKSINSNSNYFNYPHFNGTII